MNKKILVVSILAVFLLVAISFASAVSSNTVLDEKKESPLFRIRTGKSIEKLVENLKASYIGKDRVFFVPLIIQTLKQEGSIRLATLFTRDQECCPRTTGPTCSKCRLKDNGPFGLLQNGENIPVRNKLMEKEPTSGVCTRYGHLTCPPGCTIFQPGC